MRRRHAETLASHPLELVPSERVVVRDALWDGTDMAPGRLTSDAPHAHFLCRCGNDRGPEA